MAPDTTTGQNGAQKRSGGVSDWIPDAWRCGACGSTASGKVAVDLAPECCGEPMERVK